MIANALPDPNTAASVGWLVLTMAALAGSVLIFLKLADHFKSKPPASEVAQKSAETFATKGELKEHVSQDFQEHSNLWAKIGGLERGLRGDLQAMERRINEQDEARTSKLHDRLNDVDKISAALETSAQAQNEWLKRMDEKLDNLSGRGTALKA